MLVFPQLLFTAPWVWMTHKRCCEVLTVDHPNIKPLFVAAKMLALSDATNRDPKRNVSVCVFDRHVQNSGWLNCKIARYTFGWTFIMRFLPGFVQYVKLHFEEGFLEDLTHIPMEDTPDVSPTVYAGFVEFFVGVWGSLGYLPRASGAKSLNSNHPIQNLWQEFHRLKRNSVLSYTTTLCWQELQGWYFCPPSVGVAQNFDSAKQVEAREEMKPPWN